jgi:hypothetical protein
VPYHDELQVLVDILGHDLPSMDRALSRSLIDADYRRRLLQDARSAFAEEGVELPEGVSATCHEVDLNDRHFFLPRMVADAVPIDPDDARAIAAGRPDGFPDDPPVRGAVHPGVARPFLLGTSYPAPPPSGDQPDARF